ncbi:MAG: hypothetical protein WBQ73_00515 [Candidatus Babeliales bacterium]
MFVQAVQQGQKRNTHTIQWKSQDNNTSDYLKLITYFMKEGITKVVFDHEKTKEDIIKIMVTELHYFYRGIVCTTTNFLPPLSNVFVVPINTKMALHKQIDMKAKKINPDYCIIEIEQEDTTQRGGDKSAIKQPSTIKTIILIQTRKRG